MQRLKKQKVQEILDAQNAAIDADMVRNLYCDTRFLWFALSLIRYLITKVINLVYLF